MVKIRGPSHIPFRDTHSEAPPRFSNLHRKILACMGTASKSVDKSYKPDIAKEESPQTSSKLADKSCKPELMSQEFLGTSSKPIDKSCKLELVNEEMHSWVVEMRAKLDNGRSLKGPIIYKVPLFIPKINKKRAYQPRMVSFGPYNHGKPHLAWMEAHKERALLHCIYRSNQLMKNVFHIVANVAQELKDSYDSLDSKWQHNTKRFVQLMILDGCFMLEVLRVAYQPNNYYSNDDPIFSRHGDLCVMPFITADMLMLENQLPMLLLLKLKCILENVEPDIEKLNASILFLLDYDTRDGDYPKMECLHVLDLYRRGLLHTHNKPEKVAPQSPNQGDGKSKWVGHKAIRPALELHEAGIHFMKSGGKSLQDISFSNGVLKLPNFIISEHTESMFLNLIAFECCHISAGKGITSFVAFMDRIIDDSRDVKLLSSKGIIDNFIGTDEEAAKLCNTMSKGLVIDLNGNLPEVHKSLINYCDKRWPKWRANLTQTYFRNPWAIISVIAAFFLFSLTIVQTIFSILN